MTFVLSLLSPAYAVQLSDRRLTSSRGIETDEYNKAIVVITRDTRLIMGLSGLATIGSHTPDRGRMATFDVERTIAELLLDVGSPDYSWLGMAARLAERLSSTFNRPPISRLSPVQRSCDLHFVGFVGTDPPTPISTFMSNFHDPESGEFAAPIWSEFRHSTRMLSPNEPNHMIVQALGTYGHVLSADMAPLMALVRERRPPQAIVGKGVELIRDWAERPEARHAIGKQITSVILPSNMFERATAEYHSNVKQPVIYGLTEVRVDGPGGFAVGGLELKALNGPATGPELRRNERCWCGSGKKYKRCHGRPPTGKNSLIIELQQGRVQEDGTVEWPT